MSISCDGCTLCCRGADVQVLLGDGITDLEVVLHPTVPGAFSLASKPGGECIYLGEGGCTIYERRPSTCRRFDCRVVTQKMSKRVAREKNLLEIWMKGKERLRC